MKYFKFISLILLAVIYGCSNDEPKPQPTPEPTPDPDEGWVWDYYLAEVDIVIEDVEGNNLFSPEYHGILDKENLSANVSYTYQNATKPLVEAGARDDYFKSRAVEANYYGLYVFYLDPADFPEALPRIRFGEFDGTENHNETFTINWPDGTHNKIEFTSEARNPIGSMRIRVDDGDWENTIKVTFVK